VLAETTGKWSDTDDTPDDFNPVDSDQLVSGTVDGVLYSNTLHEYELAYLISDGTNTMALVWVNTGASQNGNNQNITSDGYFTVMEDPDNPGGGTLVAGTTYTILNVDISPNFTNNNAYNIDPSYSDFFVCFGRNTLIETADGERPIQSIRQGDMVRTLDNGLQPVRWIGGRTVAGTGNLAPISISKGTLKNRNRLTLSPQHRLLIGNWRAELFYGTIEVLVAAKHLVDGDRIYSAPCREIEYWHVLFDRHEIIFAEGTPTESFHPAHANLTALDQTAQDEIFEIFPELRQSVVEFGPTARCCLSRTEALVLRPGLM
jgi:hypothetical protein